MLSVRLGIFIFFLSCFPALLLANPFAIPFPEKRHLTHEDYVIAQKMLREIDIHAILHQSFPNPTPSTMCSYHEYMVRCGRCLRQVLIDEERGWFPKAELIKIGQGGDRCVVTSVSFETPLEGHPEPTIRARMAASIQEALESAGFNGYLYKLTGGYPNPTGEEIRYAGVPYAFKIFTMLEAYQLGFSQVLWIDAACLPINDPTPIFEDIKKHGASFLSYPATKQFAKYIFPKTQKMLSDLTSVNVLSAPYVCTIVFGLNFDLPQVQELVDDYYALVRLGTPFLSCFPEEFVLTALLGTPKLRFLHNCSTKERLFTRSKKPEEDGPDSYKKGKSMGFHFYQRHH